MWYFGSVSLSGFKSQDYQSLFKEFMLISVPSTWSDEEPYEPIGYFQLLPPTDINDEATQEATITQRNCPGGVTDTNPNKLKNSISVNWIAPRQPQGCVSFKYIFYIEEDEPSLIIIERLLYVQISYGSKMKMLLLILCVKIVSIP